MGEGHKARLRLLSILALLQLVAGVVAVFTVSTPEVEAAAPPPPPPPAEVTVPEPAPVAVPADPAPEPVPGDTVAADAAVVRVKLFEAAGAASPVGTLQHPTWEGVPLVLQVLEERGDWLNVRVNARPNGRTAWIRREEVTLRRVPNRIVIDVGDRTLTVLRGNDVLAHHPVGVGTARTPTPLGEFYVDATVDLSKTPNGPYGAGQLSVSGFSEVLKSFGGGIGQIAIHGTNSPGSVGGNVSNGCIRMTNGAFKEVAALAPNGTPVSIRA